MALDLYTKTDLDRAIRATVTMAIMAYAANGGRNTEHAAGVLDHGQAMAHCFGLHWPTIVKDCKEALGAGGRELLDAALMAGAIEAGR